jgi:hypothetical protein
MKRARELLVGRTRSKFGGLALKKYISIEAALPVDSRSRCETTTGGDNELFLIEKFILSRPHFYASSITSSAPAMSVGGTVRNRGTGRQDAMCAPRPAGAP